MKILFTFVTNQAILKRRSTVLSLPLQLVFPYLTYLGSLGSATTNKNASIIEIMMNRQRERERERDQSCTAKELHALYYMTWF
jgi:hypothetical protein